MINKIKNYKRVLLISYFFKFKNIVNKIMLYSLLKFDISNIKYKYNIM